jgi:hypothetical protein|tara:strand:- start:828 stop:1283 length:456 start_codon:yes stop_codon:yes gene_type:complete
LGFGTFCFWNSDHSGPYSKPIEKPKRLLKLNLLFLFVLVYGITLFLHLSILYLFDLPLWEHQLPLSYVSNFVLAASIVWLLLSVFEKNKDQVSFLFMGISLFKFISFFVLFYPAYKADGVVQKMEVLTFFIPYFVGLSLETGILVQKLNKI